MSIMWVFDIHWLYLGLFRVVITPLEASHLTIHRTTLNHDFSSILLTLTIAHIFPCVAYKIHTQYPMVHTDV
jgi:hypothetical protein